MLRTFVALVRREISERRLLLFAAAALGWVPVAAPLLPGLQRFAEADVRFAMLVALVALFGGAALLILGGTLVGRDQSEGRLGFYFARPISGWTLCAAKLAAAWILVLATVLLLAAPSAAVDPEPVADMLSRGAGSRAVPWVAFAEPLFMRYNWHPWQPRPSPPSATARLAFGMAAILFLLALTHVVGSLLRGRSAWLVLDLAGLAFAVALCWTARDALVGEQALAALLWAESVLFFWLLAAMVVAGGVQLRCGRVDPRRAHSCLSAVFWPALVTAALLFVGFSRWVGTSTTESLADLTDAVPSPDGEWVVLGGPTRHRAGTATAFLRHARSGRTFRLGGREVAMSHLTFSPDSAAVAWLRCASFVPLSCTVWAKDLRDVESPPRPTQVAIESVPELMLLGEGGTRLAVGTWRNLAVWGLPGDRLLASAAAEHTQAAVFLPGDRLRFHEVVEPDSPRTRIRELDIGSRRLVETGSMPESLGDYNVRRSPVSDMLFFTRLSPAGFGFSDGETGELAPLIRGVYPVSASRGVEQTRFFVGAGEQIVWWDAATGERHTVLPPIPKSAAAPGS